MRFFGGGDAKSADKTSARLSRASSGWTQLCKSLREHDGQRVLDIGPTSSTNINFLTGLGQSVYMANLVEESLDKKWEPTEEGAPFPADDFVRTNLDFGDRQFDTVLFWDTADYFHPDLRVAVVRRLYEVMVPGGQLLAFFHIKPESMLHRYHLREDGQVEVQGARDLAVKEVLSNRQIEQLFHDYSSYKFFLAKDNLREVIVTR